MGWRRAHRHLARSGLPDVQGQREGRVVKELSLFLGYLVLFGALQGLLP